jgi:hypothetical protein
LTRVKALPGKSSYRASGLIDYSSKGKQMQINIGTVDRVVRIVAGFVLIALAVNNTLGPWAYIGIIPLATGVFRFCPLYRVFGWNTSAPGAS